MCCGTCDTPSALQTSSNTSRRPVTAVKNSQMQIEILLVQVPTKYLDAYTFQHKWVVFKVHYYICNIMLCCVLAFTKSKNFGKQQAAIKCGCVKFDQPLTIGCCVLGSISIQLFQKPPVHGLNNGFTV